MKRLAVITATLALMATPALALPPQPTLPQTGSGGQAQQISYGNQTLVSATTGTSAGTAGIVGLSGGTWSMNPITAFNVNSSTGAVSAVTTLAAATYTPTLSYSASPVAGQTITVSLVTNIVVQTSPYAPSLDFSNSSNSQYLGG